MIWIWQDLPITRGLLLLRLCMPTLFAIQPEFFTGHLNGARIPIFLMMLEHLKAGTTVHVMEDGVRHELSLGTWPRAMDLAYAALERRPVGRDVGYETMICQKGHVPATRPEGVAATALVLNDASARQAVNQWQELLSGRFGLDLYRASAPLRYLQGTRRDRAQLGRHDRVYVQTAQEAAYLRRKHPDARAKIEIFNNRAAMLDLFPDAARPADRPRPRRFLLPVPPGARRAGEYGWFLLSLARHPELLAQTTVTAPESFAPYIPEGVEVDRDIPDFDAYLAGFDCVLVPTKHYTGMNNRVFQAAIAGCDVICSPEAAMGLNDAPEVLARTYDSFEGFCAAMEAYPTPNAALVPSDILKVRP